MVRGYDALLNPVGALLIGASLFLITAGLIAGAFWWKSAMRRDVEMRRAWREEAEAAKESVEEVRAETSSDSNPENS